MLNKKIIFILVIFSILVVGPVFAGDTITGDTTNNQSQDFLAWARWIYPFALSMAAVLAIAMIVIAGIQMMIPSPGAKEDAKKKIMNAVLGLLLAVGSYLILNTINPNLLKLELKPPVLQSPKSDEASIPGGTEVISKEDYAKKVENDPNATKTQKEAAKVLVNDPNAGEVIVPKKPEEWSKLSTSDKIKVFEKEAQKCVNKGDFGAVISSDGTVNCRECTGTKVPKPGTPTGETPKVSNCQLNQLCAGYSCQ